MKGFGNFNTYIAVLWTKIEKCNENESQKSLFVFNSHYPLSGDNNTRFECTKLEVEKIKEITKGGKWISAGDRNIIPTKNDNEFNNPEIVYKELVKAGHDVREAKKHCGISTSWIGFTYDEYKNEIDGKTGDFKDDWVLDLIISNLIPELSFCHHGAIDSKTKELLHLSGELSGEQNVGLYFSSDHTMIGGDFIF